MLLFLASSPLCLSLYLLRTTETGKFELELFRTLSVSVLQDKIKIRNEMQSLQNKYHSVWDFSFYIL